MADNNATDTREDGQRKQVHSEMELEALPSWGPTKAKGRLAKGTRVRESLENGRGREVLPNTKKQKNHTKTSPQIITVAIEVLLHPRLQKSLLLLLKNINLEERSASIANFHLLHLIHRPHTLPRSIQREQV